MQTAARRLLLGRAAAAATCTGLAVHYSCSSCESKKPRFQDLPPEYEMQRFVPAAPYPAWDSNWDYCELTVKEVARALKHAYPVEDYAGAIRKLYAEHTDRSAERVEKLLAATPVDELPSLYKRAYLEHAHGGAVTRHVILIRHGQYSEQRALSRTLSRPDGVPDRDFGMPGCESYPTLDTARKLTPLGRQQAEATGRRLAEMLRGPLTEPGRETHVRIHVSNLERAKETADLIAAALPAERVRRLAPDAALAEGLPAHRIPYGKDQVRLSAPTGVLFRLCGLAETHPAAEPFPPPRPPLQIAACSRDVHVEGSRIEEAYRSIFYRARPPYPPPVKAAAHEVGASDAPDALVAQGGGPKRARVSRHEYDIVICHGNVIRYFALRALQLPPEVRVCLQTEGAVGTRTCGALRAPPAGDGTPRAARHAGCGGTISFASRVRPTLARSRFCAGLAAAVHFQLLAHAHQDSAGRRGLAHLARGHRPPHA